MDANQKEHWNTIIIGGGQAGLATGYYLKALKEDFIILDEAAHIGDSWRNRWDSLRLFTPNWANGLPGLAFPGKRKDHATKDEMASYLGLYVDHHDLPVLSGCKVIELRQTPGSYSVVTEKGTFSSINVVIANGAYARPKLPDLSNRIMASVTQMHSSAYKRPSQLPEGYMMVVGAGTSGLQIAIDLAASGRNVFVAGTPPGRIPDFILDKLGRPFIWAMNNILTIRTIPGRKAAHRIKTRAPGAPLIHIGLKDALKAGVTPIPRVTGVQNGYPVLADGTTMIVDAIVWCTGYHPDLSWVNMGGVTDSYGHPDAYRGVSRAHKGLYFIGMPFQYSLASATINGVGRDADYIAKHISGLTKVIGEGITQDGGIHTTAAASQPPVTT